MSKPLQRRRRSLAANTGSLSWLGAGECQAPGIYLFMEVNANSLFERKTCSSGPCGQLPLLCLCPRPLPYQTQEPHSVSPSPGWTPALGAQSTQVSPSPRWDGVPLRPPLRLFGCSEEKRSPEPRVCVALSHGQDPMQTPLPAHQGSPHTRTSPWAVVPTAPPCLCLMTITQVPLGCGRMDPMAPDAVSLCIPLQLQLGVVGGGGERRPKEMRLQLGKGGGSWSTLGYPVAGRVLCLPKA